MSSEDGTRKTGNIKGKKGKLGVVKEKSSALLAVEQLLSAVSTYFMYTLKVTPYRLGCYRTRFQNDLLESCNV